MYTKITNQTPTRMHQPFHEIVCLFVFFLKKRTTTFIEKLMLSRKKPYLIKSNNDAYGIRKKCVSVTSGHVYYYTKCRESLRHVCYSQFIMLHPPRNLIYGSLLILIRLTPKNIFLLESKPAAYILAFGASVRSTKILQANRDIVLCITFASFLSPGSVSITTKSIGDSDDRPT